MTHPYLDGNISFNAQHSPMGAWMSFTCGNFGTRGGIGLQVGRPADQDLYIGVKHGDRHSDAPLRVLPFYEGATSDEAARYDVEKKNGEQAPAIVPLPKEQIRRAYGWATDKWHTPDFDFAIHTPVGEIPDPNESGAIVEQMSLIPAVIAEMTIDNTQGQGIKTAIFAIGFRQGGVRLLDQGMTPGRVGFAFGRHIGVAGEVYVLGSDGQLREGPEAGVSPFPICRWTPAEALRDPNPVHLLGTCPGIAVEVPAGKAVVLRLAIGAYIPDVVTTRLEGKYLYTRYFASLGDVLDEALTMFDSTRAEADALNRQLLNSGLSPNQQFLLAHATRSYYGSTELLDIGGQPFWIVNEGEYCMMNTLDLSVDQVFWELRHNPWVVRNLLDNFVRHYSYVDEVKEKGSTRLMPGGISFTHDMGVHNNFSPFGTSSYELYNLDGCFSHMTAEQLCNWSLMAACYVAKTNDLAWLRRSESVVRACLTSLRNRKFGQLDSSRCGTGQEITTYDSLDHSLAQTRNNVYIAVKCWASVLGIAMMLDKLGDTKEATGAKRDAAALAAHVCRQARNGVLPAVFETDNPGYASRILPAVEGLIYPHTWGEDVWKLEPSLIETLKTHTRTLLLDKEARNLFPDGGLKLSSTSNNSWQSKIAIFQHVCRAVLKLDEDPAIREIFEKSDAAHVKWQIEGSSYWACSDQILSGTAVGSKYYPRCVTAVLWLKE
jgi:hypothetical protein